MRLLTSKDEKKLMGYANKNPYCNLFIIGDILQYGFNSEQCSFYGIEIENELVAIVMKFHKILHVFADREIAELTDSVVEIIKREKITDVHCGEQTYPFLAEVFAQVEVEINECTLAVYEKNDFEIDTTMVMKMEAADVGALAESTHTIFEGTNFDSKIAAKEIAAGERIVYVIKDGDKMATISTALAFTRDAAMIIGVGTREEYRNKGYGSACIKKLAADLYEMGRRGVLFYSNPIAAKIYQKVGFMPREKYYMIKLK